MFDDVLDKKGGFLNCKSVIFNIVRYSVSIFSRGLNYYVGEKIEISSESLFY